MAVHNEIVEVVLGPTAQAGAAVVFTWAWTCLRPGKYLIKSVSLIPDEAQTANATNNSVYTLARNGSTVSTRSYASGNSVAGTPEALSIAGAQAEVSQGDELTWAKTVNGTGLAGTNRAIVMLERIA